MNPDFLDFLTALVRPPQRIDVLTSVTGLDFDEAWSDRRQHAMAGLDVPFLGRSSLLKNKRATGRTTDLADIESLEQQG